tara:strand:- start:8367 stop:8822 length:456 start_codon:yes stop_codon:yes gene_type:complete
VINMSLANDLVKKTLGQMPEFIQPPTRAAKGVKVMSPSKDSIYVTKDGEQSSRMDIARKYGVLHTKVKYLFEKYSPEEAYRLINTDLRIANGQKGIYFLPTGESVSAQKLADFYGTSRSSVQRSYRDNNKDPALSNRAIEISLAKNPCNAR